MNRLWSCRSDQSASDSLWVDEYPPTSLCCPFPYQLSIDLLFKPVTRWTTRLLNTSCNEVTTNDTHDYTELFGWSPYTSMCLMRYCLNERRLVETGQRAFCLYIRASWVCLFVCLMAFVTGVWIVSLVFD